MIRTESTSLFRNYIVWIFHMNTHKIYFLSVMPGHFLSYHYYATEYNLYHIVITATFLVILNWLFWQPLSCRSPMKNITVKYSFGAFIVMFSTFFYTSNVYNGHGRFIFMTRFGLFCFVVSTSLRKKYFLCSYYSHSYHLISNWHKG